MALPLKRMEERKEGIKVKLLPRCFSINFILNLKNFNSSIKN